MKTANEIYFGGDYNPDQWDEETINQDMKIFKEAGVNLLTLPVFAWAKLEPSEGNYDFEWLDAIIDKIWANGIHVCLATPTTAQPAWLSTKYPEVLPVDIAGRKRTHGMRVFFCVNSEKYRERAAAIAGEMAKRYAHHPALAAWHVSNEYGTYCYCENCQKKFRNWLKDRYHTVEELNDKWNTVFWGRILTDFDEVTVPSELNDDYRFQPAIQLDYMRFVTDSTVECFENEASVLRSYNPDIPVMTNMSGYIKKIDQRKMALHMDMVGWDNYPWPTDLPYFVAMKHDIMRGLKSGQSYWVTEQSPNQQNWQPYNKLKRPGEVRRLGYQGLAHGADTCLYFQMRQSKAGQEKFHGAFISHADRTDTRIFTELKKMGKEFQEMKDVIIGARTHAKAAIIFDWNNWWSLELCSGPSKDMDYLKTISKYYRAFFEQNIPVDMISLDESLDGYDVVVAPMLYMIKDGIDAKLENFVKRGGNLVLTYMSGIADENDRCILGAYPGPFKDILGLWVEETDALYAQEENEICILEGEKSFQKDKYSSTFVCDLLHTTTAQTLAVYGKDFYKGMPCLTKNKYGDGFGYYVATEPDKEFLAELILKVCSEKGVRSVYESDAGVEITKRVSDQQTVYFFINHNAEAAKVSLGEDCLLDLRDNKEYSGDMKIAAGDVLVCSLTERK